MMIDLLDIYFLNDAPRPSVPGCVFGEIRIGSFCERFASSVLYWSRARYEQQWISAAKHIIHGERAAMITSLEDPACSNFVRWWALYREVDSIVMQEQVYFLDEHPGPFDPELVHQHVINRETVSESGEPVSEWFTSVASIVDFLRRRSAAS